MINIQTLTADRLHELLKIASAKLKTHPADGKVVITQNDMGYMYGDIEKQFKSLTKEEKTVHYYLITKTLAPPYAKASARAVVAVLQDTPIVKIAWHKVQATIKKHLNLDYSYSSTEVFKISNVLRHTPYYNDRHVFEKCLCTFVQTQYPDVFKDITLAKLDELISKTKAKSAKQVSTAKKSRSQKFTLKDQTEVAHHVKYFLWERMDQLIVDLIDKAVSADEVDTSGDALRKALTTTITSLTSITEEDLLKSLLQEGDSNCRRLLATQDKKYLVAGLVDEDEMVRLAAQVKRTKQKESPSEDFTNTSMDQLVEDLQIDDCTT